jgi:hypothetical protein
MKDDKRSGDAQSQNRTSVTAVLPGAYFLLIFVCSTFAAWLLYGLLSSTGAVSGKGWQLGGAAAGFVVIFWISHKILASLSKQQTEREQIATETELRTRLHEMEQLNERLRAGDLPPVICPPGFTAVISRDNGVAIARPVSWEPTGEQIVAAFFRPLDDRIVAMGFRGNIFVSATAMNEAALTKVQVLARGDATANMEKLVLIIPAIKTLQYLEGNEPLIEPFPIGRKSGIRCRSHYPRKGIEGKRNYFDCITVIDHDTRQFYIFTLHECEELKDESLEIFMKVVASATFIR